MVSPAAIAEATAEETQQPGSTPAEVAQPSQTPSEPAEPSAAELKAEVAQLKATLRSMEGRVRGTDPELQGQIDDIRLSLKRQEYREQERAIRESDLPAAEQAQRIAEVEARRQQTEATQSLADFRRDSLAEMIEDLGVSGIAGDDPKISEFSNRWQQATTRAELAKVRREFNRYLISEPAARANKATADARALAETERKRSNQAEGTLQAGARGTPATGGTATDDNVDGLWMAWERAHPNAREENPYTKAYRDFLARR